MMNEAKYISPQEANADVVDSVLSTLTDSEIPALVDALDSDATDILMKYVFKFMGKSANCATMLKLHAQIVEKAGLGCIVRAMTDRKTV
jgi:actin related protein 2/3 complex subunit 5